ncbi:MAG: butyrate kinase [Spirochaetaceae bacterium]|nr:MAG: butyrate kinase [Spirochaetaceae bacterium]
MAKKYRILAVNPGSTSTKIAVFDDDLQRFECVIRHDSGQLAPFATIGEQYEFRKSVILDQLVKNGFEAASLHAVVGRGGLIHPVDGGTYAVNDLMLTDLKRGVLGEHASNLGGLIAREIADERGCPAFIVDPVVVDELEPVARYSGVPEIERSSIFHALNQKAVARRAAQARGGAYQDYRFIVVHMGGGITVGVHRNGRVVDVNDGLNGEGPFTPERSGGLPALKIVTLCFSGSVVENELARRIKGSGGLVAYLGTNDAREVNRRIEAGDSQALAVYEAMAYQVAKEIGAMAVVLEGRIDAILLTGGLAHDRRFCGWIEQRAGFLAPVEVYPGEDEMRALAGGALRVLEGRESVREYRGAAGGLR